MATILVTGANRGIGLEITRQLTARGDEVIAACRTPSDGLKAVGCRVEGGIDVADDGADVLAERIADVQLDGLFNNAGILRPDGLGAIDLVGVREQFEVNAIGPLRMTVALLPRLKEGAKVAIVTSRMGSLADNTSGGMYGYRMSKAAVNMVGRSLAHDLRPRGIAVGLLHPGFVQTEMTGGSGNVTPEESARGLIERFDALSMESSGTFFHANGEALPW